MTNPVITLHNDLWSKNLGQAAIKDMNERPLHDKNVMCTSLDPIMQIIYSYMRNNIAQTLDKFYKKNHPFNITTYLK